MAENKPSELSFENEPVVDFARFPYQLTPILPFGALNPDPSRRPQPFDITGEVWIPSKDPTRNRLALTEFSDITNTGLFWLPKNTPNDISSFVASVVAYKTFGADQTLSSAIRIGSSLNSGSFAGTSVELDQADKEISFEIDGEANVVRFWEDAGSGLPRSWHYGEDHFFGIGARGGTGTYLDLGSLGDGAGVWLDARGSPADVSLNLRAKGAGSIWMQSQSKFTKTPEIQDGRGTAVVTTSQGTTTTTYTDLATVGPDVTVTAGSSGLVLVFIYCNQAASTAGQYSLMSVATTDGTIGAGDSTAIGFSTTTGIRVGAAFLFGIGAGATKTFRARYRSTLGTSTATFADRRLIAIPV